MHDNTESMFPESDGATDASPIYDMLVVGAGVNGAGIARDAAGRGLSVALCEKGDIGEGTSSRSGKLIHGGLRYLENYEFRLVHEALKEREILLRMAPHIIWPTRFVLPHEKSLRPAWMIRAGLFLYDHLGGGNSLPGSRSLDFRRHAEGNPLKPTFKKGFEYSDCWVDDARLVLFNVNDAVDRGVRFFPQSRCTGAERVGDQWHVTLAREDGGGDHIVRAHAFVNAAGPWVDQLLNQAMQTHQSTIRLVKGSHIVLPKFYEGTHSYLLQHTDKRVIFVNPYEGDKLLIGTTDIPIEGDPADVEIDDAEIDYLLNVINHHFKHEKTRADIISTFSGVRPLYDDQNQDASAVTRDYVFDISDNGAGKAPLLSVYGGKITTYRRLAEHALERLSGYLPRMGAAWTSHCCLPGGDIPNADFETFHNDLRRRYPWLSEALARHYGRCYGTLTDAMLAGCHSINDLGEHFGSQFYEVEARWCIEREYARSADDILWRRTKFGLHLAASEIERFRAWMASAVGVEVAG
ncbi:glycerol-3-phosphate dehydrogenase [Salinisphaera orenii]|uniref:glycerol-3-phosphate dehydrogenase n=1 Tax=Salinisphaera orenii TaxID=856731 RepID=UPI0019550937